MFEMTWLWRSLALLGLLLMGCFTISLAEIELKPGGKGLYFRPDQGEEFRLRGYVQPTFMYSYPYESFPFEQTNFLVRRSRMDFTFSLENTKFFMEFGAAPEDGFVLPQAYGQWQWSPTRHYLKMGKMTAPFSAQSMRSSRSLLAVERFIGLRALNKLPAAEKALGLMASGSFSSVLTYYLGIFNGATRGSTGAKIADDNSAKEVEGRLDLALGETLETGVGFLFDKQQDQGLKIKSYTGATYYSDSVNGQRYGVDVNFKWEAGNIFLDGEVLFIQFSDSEKNLLGGYLSWAQWVMGNSEKGLRTVLRTDYAEFSDSTQTFFSSNQMISIVTGLNLHINPNSRIMFDLITEKNLQSAKVGEPGWRPSLITQFVLTL